MHSLVWIHTGRIRHCQSIYLEEQNNSLTWKSLNNYSKQDGTERFGDYRRINSITAWQIYIKWNAIILKLAVPYVCRFLCYIFRTKNFKLHKSIPQEPLFVAILSFIAKRYFTSVLKMRKPTFVIICPKRNTGTNNFNSIPWSRPKFGVHEHGHKILENMYVEISTQTCRTTVLHCTTTRDFHTKMLNHSSPLYYN